MTMHNSFAALPDIIKRAEGLAAINVSKVSAARRLPAPRGWRIQHESAAWSGMPLTAGKTISGLTWGFVLLKTGRLCNTQSGK